MFIQNLKINTTQNHVTTQKSAERDIVNPGLIPIKINKDAHQVLREAMDTFDESFSEAILRHALCYENLAGEIGDLKKSLADCEKRYISAVNGRKNMRDALRNERINPTKENK